MKQNFGILNSNSRHRSYLHEIDAQRAELRAREKLTNEQRMDVCHEIRDNMTQAEYDAWWETTSEADFDGQAMEKLVAMKSLVLEDGSDTSMAAQLQDAGFGSFGPQ